MTEAIERTRLDFERWISAPPYEKSIQRFESDEAPWPKAYIDYKVHLAWDAWQAALASSQPPSERKDGERLDYLERELELEQKYLRDCTREDRPLALFRRNVPITRAAIDATMKESK